ncbi:hypothetical protein [Novosphingobium sp. ERW19]|uniref:hypothetical protein n=1 Tax=Novosphingobium sp. ERW19 TaxID=2726186 RepID=UPI0011D7F03D|nr:hypothetical protein [Novosphingobium sp. ERW19]NLR37849.1 hypothetical protein [Novosphingobium sp. ERW19]TXI09427.1 MAG: hypothetical protein E6Q63_05245 [Novosphingobium sp.]
MSDRFADLSPFIAIIWITFVIAVSVLYRRRAGKPVFPQVPEDALFAEHWASGMFASNCLLVAITPNSISVVPRFPFNLMFLPEIYRLERIIPTASVSAVWRIKGIVGNNVAFTYGPDQRTLRLRLSKPDKFMETLRPLVPPTASWRVS